MELKKNEQADLEKQRGLFFQIGLVVALGIILVAFEWKKSPEKEQVFGPTKTVQIEEDVIAITRPPEVKPPPPPPKLTEVLTVVENEVNIDDDVNIDTESNDNIAVQNIQFVDAKPEEEIADEQVFIMVEDMPQFQGGSADTFREWIAKNLKYPEIASENGISGRVYIQFAVNSKGEVVDVNVVRGVDPALDKEAMRVVKSSPKWTPGKQRGKPVKVQFTFPVNFVLQ